MDDKHHSSMNPSSDVCTVTNTEEDNTKEVNLQEPMIKQDTFNLLNECSTADKGDEVVEVVAEEKKGEMVTHDRNDKGGIHSKGVSEVVQVCDSNDAFEKSANSVRVEFPVNCVEDKGDSKMVHLKADNTVELHNSENIKESQMKDRLQNTENNQNGNIDVDKEVIIVMDVCDSSNDKNSESFVGNQLKNYKSVILEDWDVEVPNLIVNNEPGSYTETISAAGEPQNIIVDDSHDFVNSNQNKNNIIVSAVNLNAQDVNKNKNNDKNISSEQNENSETGEEKEVLKVAEDKKGDSLKYPKSISKNEIVKILDESTERMVKPIVTGKDLFFSIELTKRLNEKLLLSKSSKNTELTENTAMSEIQVANNKSIMDERQKIVEILEADEIKDWKSVPSNSKFNIKENGNDMEISEAIKNETEKSDTIITPSKLNKKTTTKKFRTMDKELERTIALQQLREEFPTTRKRSRTTKKVNHIPFLASTVLEKALTSPEVTTALKPNPPKRRPCYLPDNKLDSTTDESSEVNKNVGRTHAITDKLDKPNDLNKPENGQSMNTLKSSDLVDLNFDNPATSAISNSVVKTYSVKRKSTDSENDIRSTLETIAAVSKALTENTETPTEPKPKKQKTVTKSENIMKQNVFSKKKDKVKIGKGNEKRNLELEKLLGDEGAVRMLYDTQHKDVNSSTPKRSKMKTATGLKKDLVLKTKLVKNAVMRLSGVGAEGVSLRGKRKLLTAKKTEVVSPEPLFSSTPNVVLYKPKKKQRAEASRILYRHSSSESFDSSEGYRRTSFEADGLNFTVKDNLLYNGDKTEKLSSTFLEAEKILPKVQKKFRRLKKTKGMKKESHTSEVKVRADSSANVTLSRSCSKLNLSSVPIRKSSRPRMISKKYSIWSSTSMENLSVESLGLKKIKKASPILGKKLNCKDFQILQYEHLVQVVLNPVSTLLKNSLNASVSFISPVVIFRYISTYILKLYNIYCKKLKIRNYLNLKQSLFSY